MKFYFLLLFSIFLFYYSSNAQTENPIGGIGSWRIHLPYYDGTTEAIGNGKVYCATHYALFSYKQDDGSIQRYTRVNALTDFEIATIRYSPEDKLLLVAYKNSNIDLIYDDNTVYNIPDIKDKNIIGGKAINHVLFRDHNAYLSCNFGIVVLNLGKKEIKETYYIGAGGGYLNVSALACDGTNFYAATDKGVYSADVNNPLLSYYLSWTQDTTVPNYNGAFTSIVAFNGMLFAVGGDTAKYKYSGSWSFFNNDNTNNSHFDAYGQHLMFSNNYSVSLIDGGLNTVAYLDGTSYRYAGPVHASMDDNGIVWIADKNNGLVRCRLPVSSGQFEVIQPNAPVGIGAFAMDAGTEGIWVASGFLQSTSCGTDPKGVYWLKENEWKSFYQPNDSLYNSLNGDGQNVINVAVDPNEGKHVFIGSCRGGLLEYRENGSVKIYNQTNSPIQGINNDPKNTWIGGVAYDGNSNLWVVSNLNSAQLTEYQKNGIWKSYHLGSNYADKYMFNLWVDDYNQKWINIRGLGLLVFQENDPVNPNDDQLKLLTSQVGSGGLPSVGVFSWAQDKDGAIWIGSDQGVSVIYNPGNIFSGGGFDAQKILIQQDTHYQYLLETEYVLAMAVDGANRKWFGTLNSGVYLMSADGTKEIYHFDTDNSPLLDNFIRSIAIDPITGEVFFGTDKGICSFRSDATEGGDVCDNHYVFPNPINHEYHGPIAINGLVKNASVKITDMSGQLVYQTKAVGGQALWDGNNFSGERAHTGVYMVYVTNDDGSATCVTKMLFVN